MLAFWASSLLLNLRERLEWYVRQRLKTYRFAPSKLFKIYLSSLSPMGYIVGIERDCLEIILIVVLLQQPRRILSLRVITWSIEFSHHNGLSLSLPHGWCMCRNDSRSLGMITGLIRMEFKSTWGHTSTNPPKSEGFPVSLLHVWDVSKSSRTRTDSFTVCHGPGFFAEKLSLDTDLALERLSYNLHVLRAR